jgi:hypothetical protein
MKALLSTLPFLPMTFANQSQNPVLQQISNAHGITHPLYNDLAHQHYLINLTVGTPPKPYSVLLDTGSTDLWLPAWNSSGCYPTCRPGTYNPSDSSTALDIHIPFNISYGLSPGSGMLGEYYNDSIHVGNAELPAQTFAVADVPAPITEASFWGILGLGSRYGTSAFTNPWSPVYRQLNATYTPLWEHLFESGLIPKRLFSIALGKQSDSFGSITFGAVAPPSSHKYHGALKKIPVILSGPLFTGWVINMTSVTRTTTSAETTVAENLTTENFPLQVVLDTGAPNTYLPNALYTLISAPLEPVYRTNPEGNPTPYVPCNFRNPTISNSTTLGFSFPGVSGGAGPTIRVPLKETIYPFGLPSNMGEVRGDDGEELCYFGIIPTQGPIFLLGATFLRSAYTVYSGDEEEWTVSMAQARYE